MNYFPGTLKKGILRKASITYLQKSQRKIKKKKGRGSKTRQNYSSETATVYEDFLAQLPSYTAVLTGYESIFLFLFYDLLV